MTKLNKKYSVVFPGQGSQSLAMLNGWNKKHLLLSELLQEARDTLGYDLGDLIAEGPVEKLNQTSITQPAMLLAGYASWKMWIDQCEKDNISFPTVLAGHSLGEYTALVAAGVLDFSDALRLVEYRGNCMQEAVREGEGAMAAILGLEDEKVIEACDLASAEGIVEAVNFNAPGQVVIAGETLAVDAAIELASQAGARRALKLPVSVPSHCQLMVPAARKLEDYLTDIKINNPSIPVLHNVDAGAQSDSNLIRKNIVEQLHKPVRWVETMRNIATEGVELIVECGPGKVLTGLQKRIDRSLPAYPVHDDDSLEKAMNAFKETDPA